MNPRRSIPLIGLAVLILGWGLAYTGFRMARNSRMTAEKVSKFVETTDLAGLSGEKRAEAIQQLAKRINALPFEERRQARMDRAWAGWFQEMTEQERTDFVEATLPTGFRQMIDAFEQLPEEERKDAITRAVQRMREGRGGPMGNRPPDISPEIEEKAISIGLQTLFTESSAQTKAELAPLLEELQRSMESGRMLRHRRR
jgi:hypothetical protein